MDTIQIKDKMFTVSIKEQDILKEVTRVSVICLMALELAQQN